MKILDVNFSKIPFEVAVEIDSSEYTLSFKLRPYDKKVVVDLLDAEGKLLAANEKLTFGVPLWIWMLEDGFGNSRIDFPKKRIIPWSTDGIEKKINLETLGKEVFLCVLE